jgi:hypothetical protein
VAEAAPVFFRIPTPEPSPSLPTTNATSSKPAILSEVVNEWSSPAFLKRARTSYGSLFDSDYDPFSEDDGTIPGKGRKRTRLSAAWRYESRSPTPEPVEEAMEEFTPDSLPKHTTTMMDEACQTEDLETEVAAETLADFARKATNIGGTPYSQLLNGSHPPEDITPTGMVEDVEAITMPPNPYSQLLNGSHTSEDITPIDMVEDVEAATMPPPAPTIQTQPPELNSDPAADFNRKAPLSPRLHPIPSDSLPLVSPLISHNYGFSFGRPLQVVEESVAEDLSAVPNATTTASTDVDDDDDLYGASPVRRRSNFVTHEFNGFQEPPGGGQTADLPPIAGPIDIEHQYGNWQSINAQYSHSASPSKNNDYDHEEPQMGHSYEEEQNQSEDGLSTGHGHISQYPEIDPELTGSVQYPELLDGRNEMDDGEYEDEEGHEHVATPLRPPQASVMSRSQSAQSPVVDLTSDSDDEEEQVPQKNAEGSLGGSEFEGDSEEEAEALRMYGVQDDVQTGRYVQRGYEEGESAESDADAEGDEDLVDENGDPFYDDAEEGLQQNPRSRQSHDDEEEEEEDSFDEQESYDEDEMEEEMEDDTPRGDPVIIDLLSSDEEDAEPSHPVATVPQISRSQSQRSQAESANEGDSSDENDEMDDENDIPYSERQEIRTRIQRDSGPLQADQEDDAMYEADGDEEDLEGADDASSLGDETHNPQSPQQAVSLSSGSGDEADEDEESGGSSFNEDVQEQESHDIDVEDDEPQTPNDRERLQVTKDDISEQPESMELAKKEEQSPERPPRFSNGFDLDGANDEQLPARVSYPSLPNEPSPPASVQGGSQPPERSERSPQYMNAQLPTPETSQLAERMITAESSFASTVVEVTSETTTSILNENRSASQVERSTEVQMSEVTTQVLSVQLDISHSDEGHLSAHVAETDADKDDLPETDDAVMGEATIKEPKTIDDTIAPESIDSSLIEEDIQLDQSANQTESGVLQPQSESRSEVRPSHLQHLWQRENSLIEEAVEADEDATAVESDGTDDPSETSEIRFTEQLGVTTRSAAQALAKAGTGNDEELSHDEPVLEPVPEQQKHDEDIAEEPEFTVEHPRRSHRRVKSTTSAAKSEDSARPVTPVKSHAAHQSVKDANERRSPMVVIDDSHSAPKGHDASFELALSSLESPSKPSHDLRKPPVADLKMRLSRALRTELGEFTSLKVLRYHMNQKLDILAVATTTPPEPQRAKGGPRHYQITFNITDPSIAPSGVTEVQVFRPYSHALPTISAGDGILLRNFQVSSVQKGFALRSTQEEGSSWAVFKDNEEPETRGPPVEYGDAEKNHVLALKTWFAGLDEEAMKKVNRANEGKVAARR